MPKNLDKKISLLLEDIEGLSRQDAAERIKQLVLQELKFLETEHKINGYDIERVKSMAHDDYVQGDSRNILGGDFQFLDEGKIRSLCFIRATIRFLRSKDLISFQLKYEK